MDTRFQAEDRVCRELFQLLPTHITALSCVEIDEINEIANKPVSFWGNDLETPSSLRSEMITWQMHWRETNTDSKPSTFYECLKHIDSAIFPNVTKLLTIACTLSITSCEAEHAFSTLRRTKTYLRTTMGEECLSGLALYNYGPRKR